MTNLLFISLTSFLFLLGSCSIDEVATPKKGYMLIASDFLEAKDSVLFKNFREQKGIVVKIKHMSSDSIISHFKSFQYNSQFDAVLIKSSYDLSRLSNAKVLHSLPNLIDVQLKNLDPKNNWVAIGYDPYVFDFGDSLANPMNYSDLVQQKKWKPLLGKNDLFPFYASLIDIYGRKKVNEASEFIHKMDRHQQWQKGDSLKMADYSLNKFSYSFKLKNQYSFPNQEGSGVFYDCVGFGITSHSRRYTESATLIYYLLRQHINQGFTGKLKLFPLINPNGRADFDYQNEYPKLSNCAPRNSVAQFRNVSRVLKKIKKDQSISKPSISSKPSPSSSALRD